MIQLAFYSMLSIGLNCPYIGLGSILYVSGINPFFKSLKQATVPYNYSDLRILSNFISNVNFMILQLCICPIFYILLTYLGRKSECYKKKPRLLRYGKSFICEVPLTILLFSSFNIYSSLIVDFKFLGKDDIVSMVVAVTFPLFLPAYTIGLIFFQKHFSEFREEFETV